MSYNTENVSNVTLYDENSLIYRVSEENPPVLFQRTDATTITVFALNHGEELNTIVYIGPGNRWEVNIHSNRFSGYLKIVQNVLSYYYRSDSLLHPALQSWFSNRTIMNSWSCGFDAIVTAVYTVCQYQSGLSVFRSDINGHIIVKRTGDEKVELYFQGQVLKLHLYNINDINVVEIQVKKFVPSIVWTTLDESGPYQYSSIDPTNCKVVTTNLPFKDLNFF
jgi:hypothetical protein